MARGASDIQSSRKNLLQQRLAIAVIGNHDVCPDAQEALPFPLIDSARAVMSLIAGNSHCKSARLFGVLDLNITIAEGEQPFAIDLVVAKNAFDHHFFGEGFIIILRAIDMLAEISRHIEQFRFLLYEDFISATGQEQLETALLQLLQHRPRSMQKIMIGGNSALFNA